MNRSINKGSLFQSSHPSAYMHLCIFWNHSLNHTSVRSSFKAFAAHTSYVNCQTSISVHRIMASLMYIINISLYKKRCLLLRDECKNIIYELWAVYHSVYNMKMLIVTESEKKLSPDFIINIRPAELSILEFVVYQKKLTTYHRWVLWDLVDIPTTTFFQLIKTHLLTSCFRPAVNENGGHHL